MGEGCRNALHNVCTGILINRISVDDIRLLKFLLFCIKEVRRVTLHDRLALRIDTTSAEETREYMDFYIISIFNVSEHFYVIVLFVSKLASRDTQRVAMHAFAATVDQSLVAGLFAQPYCNRPIWVMIRWRRRSQTRYLRVQPPAPPTSPHLAQPHSEIIARRVFVVTIKVRQR
jgi:hypothetical protein